MEMEEQIEANNDLEEKLDKEDDAQELAMKKIVERLATAASEKQLKKFKGILRKKFTADEKSHTSAIKKNGQKKQGNGKEKQDGKSKKKSKKRSNKPAPNSRITLPPSSTNKRDRSRSNRAEYASESKARQDNNNHHRNNSRASSTHDYHSSSRSINDCSVTSRTLGRGSSQNSNQNNWRSGRSHSRKRGQQIQAQKKQEREIG